MGLALKIDVPWNQANQRHRAVMELKDGDGEPVMMPMPDGQTGPVQITADFEVGRPAGLAAGTDLDAVLAINIGPLPLSSGRYEWRLSINGATEEDWVLPFAVRPQTLGSQFPR